MSYFYRIHAQSGKDSEAELYAPGETPELTAESLRQNRDYMAFVGKKPPKVVAVRYEVYQTVTNLTNIPCEHFASCVTRLIAEGKAVRVTTGELVIESRAKAKRRVKRKRKKASLKTLYALIIGAALLSLVLGVGIGMKFAKPEITAEVPSEEPGGSESQTVDGMVIPGQEYINPQARQITVTIDRSWSPIPREDVQLKGEVIGGGATITLPYFDPEDFFSHVPGHTWGFSTVPDAERIEYYGGGRYRFTENTKLYRVLVKYGGGSGTKDDPYLIGRYDQLSLMAEEKARGYFRQTGDISFPEWAAHTPIDTVNELKASPESEYFEYDGKGHAITGLKAPLFGRVSGSVIKGVRIENAFIDAATHKNYGFIVCEAYNYRYTSNGVTYETGETLLQGCAVFGSSMYIRYPEGAEPSPSEPPPGDAPKYAEYAIGGISGLGGKIENCLAKKVTIFAALDEYFLYAGGISGKPASVANSGGAELSVSGNIFTAGGIAGSAGGARLYNAAGAEMPVYYGASIQGCYVYGFAASVESAAGGIAGEGGTDARDAIISNAYAAGLAFKVGIYEDGKLITPGVAGGVIGADGREQYGHAVANAVSPAEYPVIGQANRSSYDSTVRLAPANAFYQTGILEVLNRNTVTPNNPGVIFTGGFLFAEDNRNSDGQGRLPYPAELGGLLEKTTGGKTQ